MSARQIRKKDSSQQKHNFVPAVSTMTLSRPPANGLAISPGAKPLGPKNAASMKKILRAKSLVLMETYPPEGILMAVAYRLARELGY